MVLRSEVSEERVNGFWGRITISLRSEAKHPQGEPKARGICALTSKTPASRIFSTVRPEVSKDRAEPVEAFSLIRSPLSLQSPDAALSPRRATHLFLLRQNKVSQKKATLLSAKVFGVRGRIRRAYGSPCGCDAPHRSEIGV